MKNKTLRNDISVEVLAGLIREMLKPLIGISRTFVPPQLYNEASMAKNLIIDEHNSSKGVIVNAKLERDFKYHLFLVYSINIQVRDECLSVNWFLSMEDACEKIEDWRGNTTTSAPIAHWMIYLLMNLLKCMKILTSPAKRHRAKVEKLGN